MNAECRAAVEAALAFAGEPRRVRDLRALTGGCVHAVALVTLDDGRQLVAKFGRSDALAQFQEEMHGLRALAATATVAVPEALIADRHGATAVLLMSYIEPRREASDRQSWRAFGEELAALHLAPLGSELSHGYGFTIDNHLGATSQPNAWNADWVEFNAACRLGHQVRLARDRNLLNNDDCRLMDMVIARLDRFLPRRPTPSLVHGDLWSGNIVPTWREEVGATFAVIDSAPSVGDALVDLAMMTLFGGFDAECLSAWGDRMGVDLRTSEARDRLAAYQLYHVLNHVNIFGCGYAGQAVALAQRLI